MFGTIAADPCRRVQKWRRAQSLIAGHDVVCFQETRGSAGDLATLPLSHLWHCTFLAFSVATGGSAGGGVLLGVHRRLLQSIPRLEHRVVCRGRAQVLCLRAMDSYDDMVIADVPMEPAWTMAARRGIVDGVHALVELYPLCAPFLLGDWNLVHPDNPRVDLRRL